MKRSPASALAPLALGLALGATAAWALRHTLAPAPATPTATTAAALPGPHSPPPALVLPARLSSSDADPALAAYLALPALPADASEADLAERAERLRALLTVLPADHLGHLLSATVERPGWPEARLRRLAFTAWTELDAPAAARWIAAQSVGPGLDNKALPRLASDATLVWGAADFDAAYAWAAALPDAKLGDHLVRALLARLFATDSARALALARARGDAFFTASRRELFAAWSKTDPAAAVRALGASLHEPGMNGDNWELTQGLARWGRTEPIAAIDWLIAQTQLNRSDSDELLRRFVTTAGHQGDAAVLADALRRHPGIVDPVNSLGWLLHEWNETKPEAALRWLDSMPEAGERAAVLEQSLNVSSSSHPEANLPLALHLPPGPLREAKIAEILERWGKQDPAAPLAWLRAQNDPSLAPLALRYEAAQIGALALSDPAAALAGWSALPEGPAKTTASQKLALAWSETDPAAAARWWLDNHPAPDTAALGHPFRSIEPLTSLLTGWSRQDPVALFAWAESQTDPALRRHALSQLFNPSPGQRTAELDRLPPGSVAELLTTVSDPAIADNLLLNHLGSWLRHDTAAARAWIDAHDSISPELAARAIQFSGVSNR